MHKRSPLVFALAFFLFLAACGDEGNGTGILRVSLTDAPACGLQAVNVTLSKIRVHESEAADEASGGWSELQLFPPRKIDIASLTNGTLEELGATALPKGRYTQIRLVLLPNALESPLNNSVVPAGGAGESPLQTPSGIQSGLKLIHPFEVGEDDLVDLVIDFDACRSVVQKSGGSYLLRPVLSVVPLALSGRIEGVIGTQFEGGGPIVNPTVTAQQRGKVVKTTHPRDDGSFVLGPLQESATAGPYDVVFTADDAATVMIQLVPVIRRGTTAVSTTAEPIGMKGSPSFTVRGTVIPAETTLRAVQSFSPSRGGASMEVRSLTTDGDYGMTLPAAPPWIGFFGNGLVPIPIEPETEVAAKYQLEASKEGFVSRVEAIDLKGDLEGINLDLTAP